MRSLLPVFGLVLIGTLAQPLFAQTFGEITGKIADSSGAAAPDAIVSATNLSTNAVRRTVSTLTGDYGFPSLAPGTYTVRVEKAGFKVDETRNVEVSVQQSVRLDFTLTVGQVSESISVEASAAQLQTENATVGTVIENKRIVELPLNGRNYLQLVSLAPNVTYGFRRLPGRRDRGKAATAPTRSISVAGQRSYVRPLHAGRREQHRPQLQHLRDPAFDRRACRNSRCRPASIRRSSAATRRRSTSRPSPAATSYHGTLFEFLRNDKLDAKHYAFTTARRRRDPFKWNQYGFTLGGPVRIPKVFNGKDRLFFMANYEAFRQRRKVQCELTPVPTAAMQYRRFQRRFGNTIYDRGSETHGACRSPATRSPRTGSTRPRRSCCEFYPSPNIATAQISQQLPGERGSAPVNKDQFILRMDFVESSKSQWFGRYSWGDENQLNEGLTTGRRQDVTNVEQYMGSNTRVLSPTMVNETRFGYTRFFNSTGTPPRIQSATW